ncbi:helix-turn-helix domain-containing protein [Xanthobacter wiegelii]|uniref:helix-turn-helix domain-containing protein n=1 Tax=Xanthobacter wiegelii TaxID=3119913 RepID=UPI0037299186
MANNLKALRKQKGLSQQALAEMMGTTRSQYMKLEKGERRLSVQWIERAAEALGVSNSAVIDEAPQAEAAPTAPPADASYPMPADFPRRRLPVYGQAAGGMHDDGRFYLNGNKIAEVFCLPALEHVRDAYAVYMHGDSMDPAYRAGDTVFVDPSRPVVSGDDVLVQIQSERGEPPLAYVKRFVERRGGKLRLRQYNPPEGHPVDLDFPLERVVSVHKVVGTERR